MADAITAPDPQLDRGRVLAARGALWLLAGSWGAKGSQTVVLLVLAKLLVPSQFGILSIAALTYNILMALNQLGLGDALTYQSGNLARASRTATTMLTGAGLVLMVLTWAASAAIAGFFHSPDATGVLRGFAVGIPFDAAAVVPVSLMTRSLQFSRRIVTDTVPALTGSAVTLGVVFAGHALAGLVAGQVAAAVARLAVALAIGPRHRPGWDAGLARELLAYGGYLSVADLFNFALLNVDYICVGRVLGPVALGYYSLAYRVCFMPYLSISVVANGAVFPYYCRLPTREAKARAAENALSLINAVSIPWSAGLVLFAGDIVLLGHKWAPAIGAVRFLAVYAFFLSMVLSGMQVLKAVGRPSLVFHVRWVHLVLLTAVVLTTVRAGITVVALDQAVVVAAVTVLTGLWTVRCAGVRPGALTKTVAMPLLGALGMALVVLGLRRLPGLGTASWLSLAVLGGAGLGVFVLIIWLVMPGPLRGGWATLRQRLPAVASTQVRSGTPEAGEAG